MNHLITITENNGNKAVSARELHTFLESKQQFADWIKNRIEEYGFIENEDFTIASQNYEANKRGGHNKKEYALTLDMAKELAMVEKNEKGKQARKYFIAVEKMAMQPQLHQKTQKLIEVRQAQRAELMQLIKANLLQGDIKKVALENNLSYESVRNITKLKYFNAKVVQLLFDKAMANKQNQNLEIKQMINQLSLNL